MSDPFRFTATCWPHINLQLTKALEHLVTLSPTRQAVWLRNWIEQIETAKPSKRFDAFMQATMLAILGSWEASICEAGTAREAA